MGEKVLICANLTNVQKALMCGNLSVQGACLKCFGVSMCSPLGKSRCKVNLGRFRFRPTFWRVSPILYGG